MPKLCKCCQASKEVIEFEKGRNVCKGCRKIYKQNYYKHNAESMKRQWRERYKQVAPIRRSKQIERNRRLKVEILMHYSNGYPHCKCCGEATLQFLTIDHIDGCGTKHRRSIGYGLTFYLWLKRNNFPAEYQVLCFNCNSGRQVNGGICPHEQEFKNITHV